MPKTGDMTQIELFETSEDVVRKTFQSRDDKRWHDEKRRAKRGKKRVPLPKAPATGPCCLRCRNWRPPVDDSEGYGLCRYLGVAQEGMPALGVRKGDVVAIQDARDTLHVGVEYLRTGEAFSCSAFDQREVA